MITEAERSAMTQKTVGIIGGGVAGLSAALALAQQGLSVKVFEKTSFLGGKAIRFACKATTSCVKCGACLAEHLLGDAVLHPGITPYLNTTVNGLETGKRSRFVLTVDAGPLHISPERCNGCGICLQQCPEPGALVRGTSTHHHPPVGLNPKHCRYVIDQTCQKCQEMCPEKAIDLTAEAVSETVAVDAIVAAHGFEVFDPHEKPYGYTRFPDVITNFELEQMLRDHGRVRRPSNGNVPSTIGFIQCVGSRDLQRNFVWCSKVCCASALRMARLIKHQQPEIAITIFYIDIQTYGKDFDAVYAHLKGELDFVRAIPGDIVASPEGHTLQVAYFDNRSQQGVDAHFDMMVLAAGMHPSTDNQHIGNMLSMPLSACGFMAPATDVSEIVHHGVFAAGAALGPMNIAESIASGRGVAWQVLETINT
jgi:heterodisulfide reductase subunit A